MTPTSSKKRWPCLCRSSALYRRPLATDWITVANDPVCRHGPRLLAALCHVLLDECGSAFAEVRPCGSPLLCQGHVVLHGLLQGRESIGGSVWHSLALDLLALNPIDYNLSVPSRSSGARLRISHV